MSSYIKSTKHPLTGKWDDNAKWIDNYFGQRNYAVEYSDGQIFDARNIDIRTREAFSLGSSHIGTSTTSNTVPPPKQELTEFEKKRCKVCGVLKSRFDFYRMNASSDGYDARCKKCISEYNKLRWSKKPKHIGPHKNTAKMLTKKFGKLLVVKFEGMKKISGENRSVWQCVCDCGNTVIASSHSLSTGSVVSCGCNKKLLKIGEKNPMWKADKVGYTALHGWVKRRKRKPNECDSCGKVKPLDLANISNKYLRNLDDWEWLCRSCHMNKDGRLKKLHLALKKHLTGQPKRYCSIKNCYAIHKAKGLCANHYVSYKVYGKYQEYVQAQ